MEAIPRMLEEGVNEKLVREGKEEEIMKAVFKLGAMKALGPNGFNGLFYHKYWEVVKDNVVKTVKSFFHSSHLLRKLKLQM